MEIIKAMEGENDMLRKSMNWIRVMEGSKTAVKWWNTKRIEMYLEKRYMIRAGWKEIPRS
jgi:hypothetical protein